MTPVFWGKYVVNTFEHQKIVKNPALVDICEDWPCTTALEKVAQSKPKVCDEL